MKKLICLLFGHAAWKPYNGDVWNLYCPRCGKHTTITQIFRDAFRKG